MDLNNNIKQQMMNDICKVNFFYRGTNLTSNWILHIKNAG